MKLPAELACAASLVDDHPDSIRRLRRLVVALAITGRLNEERCGTSASNEQLLQLDARHHQLVADGTLIRAPVLLPVAAEDLPDVCPPGALYLRLGDVARIEKGNTGIASALPGPYPLVVTAQDRASCDHFDIDAAAAIVPLVSSAGHGKASLQRLHYQEGKFALGTILAAVIPHAPDLVSARFVFEYLTAFKDELLVSQMIGTANVTLTIGKVANTPFPLLAHTVQRRVEDLMSLCDQLEVARAEREAARDRLTAASLARLNTPDPETFADDARFALDALPALTARCDQITQARKVILGLAMRGKLVAQDPGDEPASSLLTRISREIDAYCKTHRLSRAVVEPIETEYEPCALPVGWRWARLAELHRVITDGDHQPPPRAAEGIAFLTIGNVTTGKLDFADCRLVSKGYFQSLPDYRVPVRGDILYTVVGATFGRPAMVDTDREFCVQRHIAILKPASAMNLQYLVWMLRSPHVYDQAARSTTGTAQPTIGLRPLRNFAVPVPPLAEQSRIVARVAELMRVCDQLEASLSACESSRARTLEAMLRRTLWPTGLEWSASATEAQTA